MVYSKIKITNVWVFFSCLFCFILVYLLLSYFIYYYFIFYMPICILIEREKGCKFGWVGGREDLGGVGEGKP